MYIKLLKYFLIIPNLDHHCIQDATIPILMIVIWSKINDWSRDTGFRISDVKPTAALGQMLNLQR